MLMAKFFILEEGCFVDLTDFPFCLQRRLRPAERTVPWQKFAKHAIVSIIYPQFA